MLKTSPNHAFSDKTATPPHGPALDADAPPDVTPWAHAHFTTWAITAPGDPSIWSSLSRDTAADVVAVTSPPTWPTWPCPSVTTPDVFSNWPFDWSPRTAWPTATPVGTSGGIIASLFPSPPFKTGSKRRGKKLRHSITADYLDEALADFSGYLAIDEVYDGPFCILSVVDNRRHRRLAYRVLDHDPIHEDILAFLGDFKDQLVRRGRQVRGITTDGSPLYPKPLSLLWPDARHQLCEFHVLKEITKSMLHAVANLRKQLKAQIPKQPRGRPTRAQKIQTRTIARQKQRVADLFENRHLFVRHTLTTGQRKVLSRLTRGLPQLRVLRQVMDAVYQLFDRRCKMATAFARLAKLRRRVRRLTSLGRSLEKLKSPNVEKALVFLDDRLLPSTSNAVERGNRRFRKTQKGIYSVRTKPHLEERLALDLQRERRAQPRLQTITTLHRARAEAG